MNRERIDHLVEQKKEKLPMDVSIITPEEGLTAETQANWLVSLLCQMYFEHGITKNTDKLVEDIRRGDCRLWFAVKNNQPIASAALIKQSDGSVEVGRAVSFQNGVGGLLMLLAAADHLEKSRTPLVAEVRISDDFLGIPSGTATQTISLSHLQLRPQAVVPAFNHGRPNRQEMFVFSSSQVIQPGEPLFLPDDLGVIKELMETAIAVADGVIPSGLRIETRSETSSNIGWSLVQTEPFSVVIPDRRGGNLAVSLAAAEDRSPFTMIPISARPMRAGAIVECLNAGFVPCGFDRNLDNNGHLVLLLGRLKNGTKLAPIKLVGRVISPKVGRGIMAVDEELRRRII